MARVAVVSDSHDSLEAIRLFVNSLKNENVEAVIHAGDIISPFALRMFSGYRLYAVFGNNDGEKLLLKKTADEIGAVLSEQPMLVRVGSFDIAVLHGVDGLDVSRRLARALAKSGEFRLVVYGHTHRVDVERIGDALVVNPGTLSGYLAEKRTFAIVDLEKLEAEIVEL
ncbi:metallophosphoesterase [Thermofilum pendens]|uniref:Phosphoesterase n=1 Tax=Thermofilum pendens (strain DSM 2475 / Hrk 5) TaxID=368408 RepID=A1RWN1_THEPD|nr:metallophosphoesterase [Thermofilum pendens]ABL77611.1 phosphodiesterase, MJ0936 family [Thermofilum pendens Hrk 5]